MSCVKCKRSEAPEFLSTDVTWSTDNYVGHTYSGDVEGYDYRIRLLPGSGEVFTYSDTSKIVAVRIKTTFKRKTTTNTNTSVWVKYGITANNSSDANTVYATLQSVNYYITWSSIIPSTSTETVETTLYEHAGYTSELGNAMKYGMGIVYEAGDLIQVSTVTMELDVADEYVPPVITLQSTQSGGVVVGGTYHHDPNKMFTLGVNYTQAANDALQRLTATATGLNGGTAVFTSTTNYVNVSADQWKKLPVSGTISIFAQNSKASSNILTIPYVIDEYDVHFTSHTSGSIVRSDADLTISWEAVAPSTQTIDAPEKYLTEIWFDNGEGSGGDYTTLTSKTITADQLAGHNQVHMRLYSYYIMCETSQSAAPVMNLYIQQVAGTGNVTVIHAADKPFIICVQWESTGQTAYQVQVGKFISDICWGGDTQYRVPFVLENGVTYPVRVRIQDTQGVWTDWTEPIYTTAQDPLYENLPGVSAKMESGVVQVSVEINSTIASLYEKVLLYRDGVSIASYPVIERITHTDIGANGATVYSATATRYFGNDTFGNVALYAPITVDATPDTDGLVLADKTWLPLRYTVDEVQYSGSVSEEVYQRYYSGRQYPVVMRSGRKTETLSLAYADPTGALADILSEQVGTVVLFKNLDGLRFWGCLESVSPTRHRGWCAVSLTLRKVDVNEWVPLVWGTEE